MCGRFNIHNDPLTQALMAALGIPVSLPEQINIAPTQAVPVVFEQEGQRHLRLMRWWLVPHWAPSVGTRYAMFNARSETVASSRAFQGPLKYRRCIVPASSFIEWAGKQPWLIRADAQALAFAGLWDLWEKDDHYLESCTILTTAASPAFSRWHARMPVMLRGDDCERWLDMSRSPQSLTDLYRPRLGHPLLVAPLASEVGNARNTSPDLLQPIGPVQRLTDGDA